MIPKYFTIFIAIIVGFSGIMIYTAPSLISNVNIGLEFKGGYEILYSAESPDGEPVSRDLLVDTANILQERANSLGIAEPQIMIEGDHEIRVQLAGVSDTQKARQILNSADNLPLKLTEKYSYTVGGVLGDVALKQTFHAGIIALILIFAFMLIFYRGVGTIACFTVICYLWLLVLVFNAFNATLSLAAVITFVLGMGIAVDSNIIAYERIKEELRKGKSIDLALKDGEHNAFHNIMYSNIATLIAGIVLFVVGIGPIRGFSLTLILSIIISIATNVFLSRIILSALIKSNVIKSTGFFGIKIKPLQEPKVRFSFIDHRYKFFAISAIIIAIGAVMFYSTPLNYDIDFKAGTALDITLDQPITQDEATSIIGDDAGIEPATVTVGGKNSNQIAARFDDVLESSDVKKIIDTFKESYSVQYEENTSDPAIAAELASKALYVILIAIIAIIIFVTVRFSWRYAFATTISILNSALFVIAMFAIFKFEVDVTFIAAILTVIGFSTYDSVVIFDRINENLKHTEIQDRQHLSKIIGQSIWQMMPRSINTMLTIGIAAGCVYIFGAEPLQMFSLAILFGLICGTYSSICIGTPIFYMLRKKSLKSASLRTRSW
jgi:preprotein translocase SecF subunit